MDDKFILTVLGLDELAELGYKEVWIGDVPNPHWAHNNSGFIIASPPMRKNGWPAVWNVSEKVFGKQSCGNGLRKADQSQRRHQLMKGHYKMEMGRWEKQEDAAKCTK
jgi:hypothetical protein